MVPPSDPPGSSLTSPSDDISRVCTHDDQAQLFSDRKKQQLCVNDGEHCCKNNHLSESATDNINQFCKKYQPKNTLLEPSIDTTTQADQFFCEGNQFCTNDKRGHTSTLCNNNHLNERINQSNKEDSEGDVKNTTSLTPMQAPTPSLDTLNLGTSPLNTKIPDTKTDCVEVSDTILYDNTKKSNAFDRPNNNNKDQLSSDCAEMNSRNNSYNNTPTVLSSNGNQTGAPPPNPDPKNEAKTPVRRVRANHRRNLSLDFRAMGIELPPLPELACTGGPLRAHRRLHNIPEGGDPSVVHNNNNNNDNYINNNCSLIINNKSNNRSKTVTFNMSNNTTVNSSINESSIIINSSISSNNSTDHTPALTPKIKHVVRRMLSRRIN